MRPKGGYFNSKGVRLPSVTTVGSRFQDKSALMIWAFNQGREGKESLYEESGKAADVGTLAHLMVEARIKGLTEVKTPTDDPGLIAMARQALAMYDEWASQTKLKVLETEIPLVSERYQYGGTPDAIGEVNGKLCLIDWKTSGAVYVDHLVQVAAYGALWEENNPERPLTGGYHILRFAKESADFAHRHFLDLQMAWEQFIAFRACYERDKTLRKRVG